MPAPSVAWELVEPRLRQLAADKDLSAMDIAVALAAEFGIAITRNAVVGKMYRLKLRQSGWNGRAFEAKHTMHKLRNKPRPRRMVQERPAGLSLSIMELGPQHCRWPIDAAPAMRYCGATASVRSYCAEHAALAYLYQPRGRS
jgi:hypothetical protein